MRRPKTVITTLYPTAEMVAAELKISKKRLREIQALMEEIRAEKASAAQAPKKRSLLRGKTE
jgi:hypothetical protein